MGRITLGLLLCFALADAAAAQQRVALVIGNTAYRYWPTLPNPRNDAEDMSSTLRQLGFKVIGGLDLDKTGLDRKVREFADALAGARTGVFFYAGHGLQEGGDNYVIPIDARLASPAALETEAVRFTTVQGIMESLAKENVLFFDACRNNPLDGGSARPTTDRSGSTRGLTRVHRFGAGTFVAFSAQPGAVAADGTGRNSAFTRALVRSIGVSNDDIGSIMRSVRKEVLAATKGAQVPWNQDNLIEDIYLKEQAQSPQLPAKFVDVPVASFEKPTSSSATRRSVWVHNDSELVLLASGVNRAFYYKRPSPTIAGADVREGTLLFEGKVDRGRYVGTAYRFSARCPARSYRVEGPIKDDGRIVELQGPVARLDTNTCIFGPSYKDELIFKYLRME